MTDELTELGYGLATRNLRPGKDVRTANALHAPVEEFGDERGVERPERPRPDAVVDQVAQDAQGDQEVAVVEVLGRKVRLQVLGECRLRGRERHDRRVQ